MTNTLDIEDLKHYNNWALCFAKIGEKQPIVITKKWVDKVLAVYPHYFDYDNQDYISQNDDLWLNYTATVTPTGGKSYSGDLVNTGSTINFKDAWLSYEMVDKICRNSLMLFPVNRERQLCMGFMFTQDTPFTIIDFDRKEETSSQEIAYQDSWIQKFNSYTERSVSGNGYHVIIEGKIDPVKYPNTKGTGASGIRSGTSHKKQGIAGFELYSEDRFVVFTEEVCSNNTKIYNRQTELDELCAILKKPVTAQTELDVDTEYKFNSTDEFLDEINWYLCELMMCPDWEVINDLFEGRCNYTYENDATKSVFDETYTLTFPSQSEADFRLMSLIGRYCKNDDVVKSIFSQSKLARRAKATRIDYLNRMIEKVRENERNEDLITDNPFGNATVTVTEDGEQTVATVDEIIERIETKKVKEKEAERKALINEFINKDYLNTDAETVLVNSKWQNEETDPSYTAENLFCDIVYSTGLVHQLKRANVVPSSEFILFNSDADLSFKRLLDKGFICTKGFSISELNALIVPPVSSALLYEITKWSYETRIKPILEVSVASAIAIISGIVGKMWQLPTGTGLNNYIILSARSGIGKEGLHTTKNDLQTQLRNKHKDNDFRRHIVDDDFMSGQALLKRCLQESGSTCGNRNNIFNIPIEQYASFTNFQKEFGKNLSEMSEQSKNAGMQSLRSQYLRLYTGSAQSDMLSGMTYSNAENNFSETYAPAFSIVGEATISGIADAFTPEMAQDGLLSRFTTITYKGGAVPQNKTKYGLPINDYVLDKLYSLLVQERTLSGHCDGVSPRFVQIQISDEADKLNTILENWCMDMLDQAGDKEHFRQAWNRCQLKTMKLAGLCAVCQNDMNPIINIQHMAWAMRLVMLDIANIYDMITNGETALTGNAENTMATSLLDAMKKFVIMNDTVMLCTATNIPAKTIKAMRTEFIVPLNYLTYILGGQKVFLRYKAGYMRAISITLDRLVREGAIEEVQKAYVFTKFNFRGACYKLLDLRGIN